MYLVDSHCHLDLLDGHSIDFIKRARETDVGFFLNVCITMSDFPTVLATANEYPFVAASVGLHPNYPDEHVDTQTLIESAQHPKIVAIGETGLDYFRSEGNLDWQRERFRSHIHAAKAVKKPLIIHTRNAKEDTIKIMQEEHAEDVGGVMHCFTEDWDMAKQALAMSFMISFSGIVTFKNATQIQEVAKLVPADRFLIETDCPYLAPNPHRGKPNEPAYLKHTAQFLADLRGVSYAEIAEQSTTNFFNLFTGAVRPHV